MSRVVFSKVTSATAAISMPPAGEALRGLVRHRPLRAGHEFRPATVEHPLGGLAEQMTGYLPGERGIGALVTQAHGVVERNLVDLGPAARQVAGDETPVLPVVLLSETGGAELPLGGP